MAYELVSGEEAPLLAIRYLLGLGLGEPFPALSVRLGTTRGTNALLTRRGARTALVTTRGFGDVLKIGNQNRPKLFELAIKKHEPLACESIEIDERVTSAGDVLRPLDEAAAFAEFQALRERGIESLAICLLNAYCQAGHERRLAELARAAGFDELSVSHLVAPLIKLVARADTTVLDAYLNPVLKRYVERLQAALGPAADLRLITSAGALATAADFSGKDSILSGPAGGVVGFSRAALAAGFPLAIGFDMGGTSTDVSRFDGSYEMEYETEKAGVRVVTPMLAIETVAAGGGSICAFDGVKLTVGPDSAGADPGPACYGAGGPLTVTDMNLFLGRISARHFPFPLDRTIVAALLRKLCADIEMASDVVYKPEALAEGFLKIANAKMAQAIQSISIAKGYDVRDYALVAFGGAAGQHACAVANELGITRVLIHPQASLLSAWGIGLAEVTRRRAAGVYKAYSEETIAELEGVFDSLADEERRGILLEGVAADAIATRRLLDLRYKGQDAFLTIAQPLPTTWRAAFEAEHQRMFGHVRPGGAIEIVAARVELSAPAPHATNLAEARFNEPPIVFEGRWPYCETVVFDGQPYDTPIVSWSALIVNHRWVGPTIVLSEHTVVVAEPQWQGTRLAGGEVLLTLRDVNRAPARPVPSALDASASVRADPVLLEVFNNHFAAIAQQMGVTLRNTASSVNVKERLDFSCALFTSAGELVVNAPHIPVHLGAMGETVRRVIEDNPAIAPGDVFVTNDPFRGGSHLPDVTVVTPVHDAGSQLLFFAANRAHHAEIGGVTPGSMPPFSRSLAEEGVLIRNFKLISAGQSREEALRALLQSGPYPSRAVEDNLADIAAQVAANRQGARDLASLIERHGRTTVFAYMRHIQAAAETKMRAALARLPSGRRTFRDYLDDGSPIQVAIDIGEHGATIDFTGSGNVLAGNLNSNRAIVSAAVMYCFRCLIDEDIPLNEGVLAPIKLLVPEGLLNPPAGDDPSLCAAVAGGNVETSQRVVDVLLGALGVASASQGTMNNLLFGDGSFGYYETICGGAGATPLAPGADAVHTHMTNTRITDPEVLERRYPARVVRFAIRRGSGGAGQNRGGDGALREIEFLAPLSLSILSQRRGAWPPYGLAGGEPGKKGVNVLKRVDGSVEVLPAITQVAVGPGDRILIETPGGGAYGSA
jgi:5-oxoprolinase (ATP-hydrolysing)